MTMVYLEDLLACARRGNFAVTALEVRGLAFLQGALRGAEHQQAPVVLVVDAGGRDADHLAALLAAMEQAAQQSALPVVIHGSGIASLSEAVHAINSGCNSLGLDAALTARRSDCREVVRMAHGCGVPVLGRLGMGYEQVDIEAMLEESTCDGVELALPPVSDDSPPFTDAAEALCADLARLEKEGRPPLLLVRGRDPSPSAFLRQALQQRGAVWLAGGQEAAAQCLAAANGDYDRFVAHLGEKLAEAVAAAARDGGGAGQAEAARAMCRVWSPVEHLIIYNVSDLDASGTEAMMRDGRRILGAIPGVRQVFTGMAVKEEARYRYCWLVRFVHPSVIDSYRHHPDHVAFADNRFRPVAGDRVSIDYQAYPD